VGVGGLEKFGAQLGSSPFGWRRAGSVEIRPTFVTLPNVVVLGQTV